MASSWAPRRTIKLKVCLLDAHTLLAFARILVRAANMGIAVFPLIAFWLEGL